MDKNEELPSRIKHIDNQQQLHLMSRRYATPSDEQVLAMLKKKPHSEVKPDE